MIEPLRSCEIPSARALLARVDLAGGAAMLPRYVAWQPDGAWAITDHGAVVAMVTVLRFGAVGFVGCMAVAPERQGHGLGRALLEHAHAESRRAGVATFLLEATPVGERLYTRLGYGVDGDTWILARARVAASAPRALAGERAAILELDRRATGMPRDPMIGDLVDHAGGELEHRGALVGYGLVVGERLGPVIASDPGAGRALVERLAGACTVAAVPAANAPAMAAYAAAGFTCARALRRMRLGPPVASRPDWQWGLASPGAG